MNRSLLLVLLLLGSACATFSELPPATVVRDSKLVAPPSAYLEVDVDAYTVLPQGRGPALTPWGWPRLVESSLSTSGLFSTISRERSDQELNVSLSMTVTQTPMSNALLCLATGFLVPAFDERGVSVVATIHDPGRQILTRAESRHTFRTWLELFLLPLWFTHDPGGYEYNLAVRLAGATVSEALRAWAAKVVGQETGVAEEHDLSRRPGY